jgi:GNAT superfamily N-acetyltransferase
MRLSAFALTSLEGRTLGDWLKTTTEHYSPEQLQQRCDDPASLLFSATFNERHIGAVVAKQTAQHLYVEWFSVREVTWRRGVGLYLLIELTKWCKAQGIKELTLPEALPEGFYQSAGLHAGLNTLS